jgi:hypothetical protein
MKDSMVIVAALVFFTAMPAQAQVVPADEQEQQELQQLPPPRPTTSGRVAESTVGEVGQRQTREQSVKGIKPMARIASRVQNRVQNRIRNRIDRNYDPQSNTTDPFVIAEDQVRSATRPRQ